MNISEHMLPSSEHFDLQHGLINSKKKKCHGNRKLQHFKRSCRAKGMNNETIEMLISIKKSKSSVHQNHSEEIDNESTEHSSIAKDINNDVSIIPVLDNNPTSVVNEYSSMMMKENSSNTSTIQRSISLQSIPTEYEWIPSPAPMKAHKKKTKYSSLSSDQWKRSSLRLMPKYGKLPDCLFKHLLCKNVSCYRNKIRQWLTNAERLQFFRQCAELMRVIFQLKIEQDYWTYVLNLGTPAMTWLSTVVKNLKQRNYINWDYPRTADNVLHRQKIIEKKLLQTQNDLDNHIQQQQLPDQFCEEIQNKILFKSLGLLIQNDLSQFRTNFQQKKILLKFDVNDVHHVKSFYGLNPTEEQISCVQKIWRMKVKSCKRTISQMKNPSLVIYDDHDCQQCQLLSSIEPFDHSMRTIVEARLENIEQRTQQILKFINESST